MGQAADEMAEATGAETKFLDDLDLEKNFFSHETKAGAIFTTGNTQSLNVSAASQTLYRVRRFANSWRLGAYFNRVNSTTSSTTAVGTIAKYIYGVYRLDYYFLPLTTVYLGGGGYTDEVKDIDLAWQGFTGISHFLIRTKKTSLNIAGGYNFTYENRAFPSSNQRIHAATIQVSYLQEFNEHVSFLQDVSYLQNVKSGKDVRVNSDTELKVKLIKHLALVLGFHVRFDNRPAIDKKKLDTISDVSLALTF